MSAAKALNGAPFETPGASLASSAIDALDQIPLPGSVSRRPPTQASTTDQSAAATLAAPAPTSSSTAATLVAPGTEAASVSPAGSSTAAATGSPSADPTTPSATSSSFRLISEERDSLGMVHLRYQQLLNGLPLIGSMAIEHRRAGVLSSVSGDWVHMPPAALASQAALKEDRALASALSAIGATSYKWQLPEEEAFLKADTGDASATFSRKGNWCTTQAPAN